MTTRRPRQSRRVVDDDGAIIPERVGAFDGAPTVELARHKQIEVREQRHGQRPGVRVRDTIATLVKQGYIDAAGEDAAKKYRDLRELAMGVRSGDNGGVRMPHWMTGGPTAAMLDAETAIREVKQALPIPTWILLDAVCLDNRSLSVMSHVMGMSVREVGQTCGEAMTALAGLWARPKKR